MIIITGASRGIGKYLFDSYSKTDEITIGTYLSTIKVPKSDKLHYVDVTDFKNVESFLLRIKFSVENIVLINCAGITYNSFLHKSEPEKWKSVIDVNLVGTYNVIRVFLPFMREQNFGRIINFSSVVAKKGTPGVSAYAASKAALTGLTKSLCVENGSKNITVNNINLGYAQVGMGVEQVPDEFQTIIKSQIPSHEFCSPEDIYSTVEYLRNTPYVNGSSIDLNGGLL